MYVYVSCFLLNNTPIKSLRTRKNETLVHVCVSPHRLFPQQSIQYEEPSRNVCAASLEKSYWTNVILESAVLHKSHVIRTMCAWGVFCVSEKTIFKSLNGCAVQDGSKSQHWCLPTPNSRGTKCRSVCLACCAKKLYDELHMSVARCGLSENKI